MLASKIGQLPTSPLKLLTSVLSACSRHVDQTGDVRRRQARAVRASRRQCNQVVLAGSDRAAQRLLVEIPAASRGRGVLQRPSGEVHNAGATVVQLDVVVEVGGAG